eukprot:m.108728 g.108728  ORF g.108728 m.108728 type:complete len:230 (-) comp15217_c1_seq4:1716-2405(-)
MVNSFFSLFLLFISIDHLLSGIFLDVMRTCGRLFLGFRLVQHSSLPPQAGKNFGHHNNERIRLVKFHLRQELPQIIAKSPSETLNLCHPDLIFKDNIHGFTLHGRNAFKVRPRGRSGKRSFLDRLYVCVCALVHNFCFLCRLCFHPFLTFLLDLGGVSFLSFLLFLLPFSWLCLHSVKQYLYGLVNQLAKSSGLTSAPLRSFILDGELSVSQTHLYQDRSGLMPIPFFM